MQSTGFCWFEILPFLTVRHMSQCKWVLSIPNCLETPLVVQNQCSISTKLQITQQHFQQSVLKFSKVLTVQQTHITHQYMLYLYINHCCHHRCLAHLSLPISSSINTCFITHTITLTQWWWCLKSKQFTKLYTRWKIGLCRSGYN